MAAGVFTIIGRVQARGASQIFPARDDTQLDSNGVDTMKYSDHVGDLIEMVGSEDLDTRVSAIQALGEIGDQEALSVLRERLACVNRELSALVVAVGKIKRRLKIE